MLCPLNSPGNRFHQSLCLSVALLACVPLFSSQQLYAQENATEKREPFRLDLVPDGALAVIAFRPAQLLEEPVFKPIRELLLRDQKQNPDVGFLGLVPTEVKSVTVIYLLLEQGETSRTPFKTVFLVETANKLNRDRIKKKFSKSELIEKTYHEQTFLTNGSIDGDSLIFLDEKSFLVSDHASALKKIIDQLQPPNDRVWAKRLTQVSTASFAGGVNMQTLRTRLGDALIQPLTRKIPAWPMIAPIWQNTQIATLGVTIQKDFSLELIFEQKNNSEQIKQALDGLLLVGQNIIRQFQATLEKQNRSLPPEDKSYLEQLAQVLSEAQVIQNNKRVTFSSSFNQNTLSQMVNQMTPAAMQARAAARRSRSKTNIKLIMLALHSYVLKHGHFPPAVVMGPDGKTPHSWRVELLPFLDQQALYDKYRLNEPWDSEHNLKIAETMVPVFHCPGSEKPTNSSYFVVVGEGTAFGNKKGISFKDITDGTSNTIAIVEAKRDIPWTKPEDITYDGKQLPEFGGFFENPAADGKSSTSVYFVGLCDGRVRIISETIDPSLLTIADGKPKQ